MVFTDTNSTTPSPGRVVDNNTDTPESGNTNSSSPGEGIGVSNAGKEIQAACQGWCRKFVLGGVGALVFRIFLKIWGGG